MHPPVPPFTPAPSCPPCDLHDTERINVNCHSNECDVRMCANSPHDLKPDSNVCYHSLNPGRVN